MLCAQAQMNQNNGSGLRYIFFLEMLLRMRQARGDSLPIAEATSHGSVRVLPLL